QELEPAGRLLVRVERTGDDAGDAGLEHRPGAWRRRAVVAARLHRHVERRASRPLARGGEGDHLGVRSPLALVPALSGGGAATAAHRADDGIRAGRPAAALGELEGPSQVLVHATARASSTYAAPGSSASNTAAPATNSCAPASRSRRAFSRCTPPSTWT